MLLRRRGIVTRASRGFGSDHLDDLPSAGERSARAGRRVGQRAGFRLGRLGEVGDDGGIDGIGLGPLADRLAKARMGVDDNDGSSAAASRRHDRLEAPVASKATTCGESRSVRQLLQSGGITLDHEHISTRTHGDIEVVLGNVKVMM